MFKRVWMIVLVLAMVGGLTGGCAQQTDVGSAQHPVQLYFVPSVEVSVIVQSGETIAEYLKEQTGLEFEVKVPTTYAAVVEEMGAAEGDAMAFIPALGYVLAADKYDADVSLAVVRYGWGYYWTQYLVGCDSGLTSLADLEGKSWAYPDVSSTSGYLVPATEFATEGVTPGDQVAAGGHPQSVIALYEGQVDFATTFYSPPGNEGDWELGDPPQPEGEVTVETEGDSTRAFINGMQLRDARSSVLGDYPDVFDKVCILGISNPIPNDTVSFADGFPADSREAIVQALIDYAGTDAGQEVLANDEFYDITGFTRVEDSAYDPIRDMVEAQGMTEEEILE